MPTYGRFSHDMYRRNIHGITHGGISNGIVGYTLGYPIESWVVPWDFPCNFPCEGVPMRHPMGSRIYLVMGYRTPWDMPVRGDPSNVLVFDWPVGFSARLCVGAATIQYLLCVPKEWMEISSLKVDCACILPQAVVRSSCQAHPDIVGCLSERLIMGHR